MVKGSRAEIVPTGSIFAKSARIVIEAPAAKIFDLVANPRRHLDFDGSGHLKGSATGPERLSLGAKFGMAMEWKAKYRTVNSVVEFEEGRQIAWSHFAKHRWRYELRALDSNTTEVTETFDGRTALLQTLPRLKVLAES